MSSPNDGEAAPAVPEEYVLTIRVRTADGHLFIDGPVDDEALCDWMLKKCGRAIERRADEQRAAQRQQAGGLVTATAADLSALRPAGPPPG